MAIASRGTLTGNRGILHGQTRELGTARWTHKAWICCTLDWQGRKRAVMTGRNWTELFFLDEAVAFAAGHRPCGYCRRAAYSRFVDAWESATGQRPKAPDMDRVLHSARVRRDRSQVTFEHDISTLPDGTMIQIGAQPYLVMSNGIYPYTPNGYQAKLTRPTTGSVTVLTPAPSVAVLAAGYAPVIHESAV